MSAAARLALLVPPAAAVVLAAVAGSAVPTTPIHWASAGAILAAALAQAEITRRIRPARQDEPDADSAITMASVWSLAAAVAVPLALAVAVVLLLFGYRFVRARHDGEVPDSPAGFAYDAGMIAWSAIAAHFAASTGAWTTLTAQAGVRWALALAVAAVAHLAVNYALAAAGQLLRHGTVDPAFFGHAGDVGLKAALLVVGVITGALAANAPIAVLVAIPVVITLHSAALTPQLEDAVSVDQKTGLATAAAWQATAEQTFADAEHGRHQIGLLMIDLDHFKRLNDTYGHRAGDDVLAAVGDCLRAQLRKTDLGGRFGGEEFTVLLADTDVIDTVATAERIRTAISQLHVETIDTNGDQTVISDVTASIGAATYPHHGTTVEDCLRVADNHVYRAKRNGRNRVVGIDTENLASHPRFS
jgi:diguanylate cyclase (GGDEF)-like protein